MIVGRVHDRDIASDRQATLARLESRSQTHDLVLL
jgi:hypothetical protein